MKLYFTRRKYGNTWTKDLWAAFSEASRKPVGSIMLDGTKQMGFPIIQVTAAARQEGEEKRILQLSQQRFLADGTKDENNTMWMVQNEITTSSMSFVLEGETAEIVLNDIKPHEWFKVIFRPLSMVGVLTVFCFIFLFHINVGQVAFYRTCYKPELLKHLVSAIDNQTLPPLDRLSLLNDLFALVQAGHYSTVDRVEVLILLEAFANEDQ